MYDAVLFDLDDTLYQNRNISQERTLLTKEWIRRELDLACSEVDGLYGRLQQEHPHPYNGLQSLGLSVEGYFDNVFERVDPGSYLVAEPRLSRVLSSLPGAVYVVSLSPKRYARRVLDELGVADHVEGVSNPYQDEDEHSKRFVYRRFADRNCLVVGDSYRLDLSPAEEVGFDSIHVDGACSIDTAHVCLDSVLELPEQL